MMRTLGQYMVGSAATFGYARERNTSISQVQLLTLSKILHVHRHNHPHRELAHHDRSLRPGPRQPRSPNHHKEAVGAEEEAGSRGVEDCCREKRILYKSNPSLPSSKSAQPHVSYYEGWELIGKSHLHCMHCGIQMAKRLVNCMLRLTSNRSQTSLALVLGRAFPNICLAPC